MDGKGMLCVCAVQHRDLNFWNSLNPNKVDYINGWLKMHKMLNSVCLFRHFNSFSICLGVNFAKLVCENGSFLSASHTTYTIVSKSMSAKKTYTFQHLKHREKWLKADISLPETIEANVIQTNKKYKPHAKARHSCNMPECIIILFTGWIQVKPKHKYVIRKKTDDKYWK